MSLTNTDTFDYSQLDEGIRETVRWLRKEGFDVIEANAFLGTITIKSQPINLALDLDDLVHVVMERGIIGPDFSGDMNPARATLTVTGLTDALLAAHPEPENITRPLRNYGALGYSAYAQFTGGKTFDGRDMPKWGDLPERIQRAWNAAADAVRKGRLA